MRPPKTERQRAFSLIEMVGVLAVVAVLALALVTVTIRYLDRIAAEKETAQLKSLAEGFRQGVINSKIIPNRTGWYSMIATNLGLQTNQVTLNDRRLARVFLIDPSLRVGTGQPTTPPNINNTLPYTQDKSSPSPPFPGSALTNSSGNVIPPASPRVMIVSSLSLALPAGLTNGVWASTGPYAFTNIWNAQEGTNFLAGIWNGKGEDLKVQRIHLADLFVQVVFNNQDPLNDSFYSVDNDTLIGTVPGNSSVSRFFLDSTLLKLLGTNGLPQHSEILHESRSFVSELGSWTAGGFFGVTIHHPSALDLQMAADAVLTIGLTTNNPAATYWPTNVYDAMTDYMAKYVTWAGSGFDVLFLPDLQTSQTALNAISKDLVSKQH